jgi:hypothetical protein
MTYKFQRGAARLSGSAVFEGTIEAEASDITGSALLLADASGIAGDGLEDDGTGKLRVKTNGITSTMLSGNIPNSKLTNSSINIVGQSVSLGGTISAATVAAAVDHQPLVLTNVQALDTTSSFDLTIFDTIGDATLTIGNTSTSVVIPGNLTVEGTNTVINSEIQIADNYMLINSDFTAAGSEDCGFVFNVDPTADAITTDINFSSSTEVVYGAALGASFAANALVLITGAENVENDGIYEIQSVAFNPSPGESTITFKDATTNTPSSDVSNWINRANFTINNDDDTVTIVPVKVMVLTTDEANNEMRLEYGDTGGAMTSEPFVLGSAAAASGSIQFDGGSTTISSDVTISNTLSMVDTSAARILTMPDVTTNTVGQIYYIKDATGNAATNNITINDSTSGHSIDGDTFIVLESDYAAVTLVAVSGASGFDYVVV